MFGLHCSEVHPSSSVEMLPVNENQEASRPDTSKLFIFISFLTVH